MDGEHCYQQVVCFQLTIDFGTKTAIPCETFSMNVSGW
jgi:hypothetical protein